MNKQRKVLITITYNEMGIIIDTKAEEVAQPERLTDDDFETIRIHLNAYKEKLCNQQRWEEADEYQRIIDRFMAFASAQPTQTNADSMQGSALDCVIRQQAIDAVNAATVITNPEHFKGHEKFTGFMEDEDISSFGKWERANGFNTALVETRILLGKLPFAQPEARWILCGEKLPNEEEEVLVTSNSGIFIAAWSKTRDNKIYWYETVEGKSIHKVTAWMPLPEPYGGPLPERYGGESV